MATRNGSARWSGDLATGSGRVTVGEQAWTGDYSYASRFEDGAGTNPEELIAAAHAGCFSMALSHVLAEADHTPSSIETRARVHLRPVDGVPTIRRIDLDAVGDAPGLDEDSFRELAERARATCAVSRALAGVEQITVSAKLAATETMSEPTEVSE
jgi:osmotically inducible protein OsmC